MVFTRVFRPLSVDHDRWSIAGVAAIVRWIAFPLVWPLGLGVAGFFGVQALHCLSTALMLIGLQKMIAETVSEEQTGAAQGIAFFANGFCMAVVDAGCPVRSTTASAPYGFFAMVPVALIGTGAGPACRRAQPQSAGSGGDTSDPR